MKKIWPMLAATVFLIAIGARGADVVRDAPATQGARDAHIVSLIHDLGVAEKKKAAFEELVRIGPAAVPALLDATDAQEDPSSQSAMSRTLFICALFGQMGERAVPPLLADMNDPHRNPIRGARMFATLRRDGKSAIPAMVAMLKSPKWESRFAAVTVLESVGRYDARPAVAALIAALHDREELVRDAAAKALGEIGPEASASAPELIAAVKDPSSSVRASALGALGTIDADAKQVIPLLLVALGDSEVIIRAQAARSLGRLGPDAGTAVAPLIVMLTDESYPSGEACNALARIAPRQSLR